MLTHPSSSAHIIHYWHYFGGFSRKDEFAVYEILAQGLCSIDLVGLPF